MSTTIRTDAHRPSAIIPADYRFVACDYYGPMAELWLVGDRAAFRADMERTGGRYSGHEHGGTCHICGAHAMYVAKFHHAQSNTYIVTGMDCAEKMDMGDAIAFRSIRKRVAAGRKAQRGVAKAEGILAEAGLTAAWTIYRAQPVDGEGQEESTVRDMVGRLVQYGSISEKAMNWLRVLVTERIPGRAERKARFAAEAEAALPVPASDQRQTVVGTVLSIKEGHFGPRMLVKHADGWKVFGSVPTAIAGIKPGSRVQFDALIKRSDRDEKFGFFSRPTKVSEIEVTA
jgi:hypothetical protein